MKRVACVGAGEKGLLAPADLGRVLEVLADGEPVGLPTETVYGLAADALSPAACARVFSVKERPFTDPLICHLPQPEALADFTEVSPLAAALAREFWPGPLTLVLPKKPVIPDLVTAGSPKVAVRCSAHPTFAQVAQAWGKPLAAPSANRFGHISPTTAEAVLEELGDRLALVVDGGPCLHGLESTIVEPVGDYLHLLRRGPIQPEELEKYARVVSAPAEAVAPGRLPWHYAPSTPLRLLRPGDKPTHDPARCGLLAWQLSPQGTWGGVEFLSRTQDFTEAAHRFYAALRRLDAAGWECLYAEEVPEIGLGRTLMERLRKAAARG